MIVTLKFHAMAEKVKKPIPTYQQRREKMAIIEYTPMRVSHIVISRPSCSTRWWECARFDDPISASNYCIFLRKRANDPRFECTFIEESVDRVEHKRVTV